MADRVKLFMVFYLRFLSIPCIIFIAILERYGCIPLMIKTEDSSVRLTVIPTIHTVTDDLGTFILASLFIKNLFFDSMQLYNNLKLALTAKYLILQKSVY